MYTDGWHCSGDWFMCGVMWCWGKSVFVLCDASISVDLAGFKACKQAQSCWCALSTKSNKRTEDHWLFSECLFYWTGVILFSLQMWSFVKMSFSTTAFTPVQKLITYEFIPAEAKCQQTLRKEEVLFSQVCLTSPFGCTSMILYFLQLNIGWHYSQLSGITPDYSRQNSQVLAVAIMPPVHTGAFKTSLSNVLPV